MILQPFLYHLNIDDEFFNRTGLERVGVVGPN